MRTPELKSLFCNAKMSHEILRGLYALEKARTKSFSIQYMSDRLGVSSKGQLGDLMAGRRIMRAALALKVMDLFHISGLPKRLYLTLVELETERSTVKKQSLEKKLLALRAQIRSGPDTLQGGTEDNVLQMRIFCSLGLFQNPPSRDHVKRFFSSTPAEKVDQAVYSLIRSNAIEERNRALIVTAPEMMFGFGSSDEAQKEFIKALIEFAKENVSRWFDQPRDSYFTSTIVSVKKGRLQQALPQIRSYFEATQTDLEENSGGDALAYFNIQIFGEQ